MNPLNLAARLIAAAVHEGIAEYRRLDAASQPAPAEDRPEMSCTQATTERAWSPTVVEAPATVFGFGFRRQP